MQEVYIEMNCETCDRQVSAASPITRKLMWHTRYFCSGQCAAEFDWRLLDPHAAPTPRVLPAETEKRRLSPEGPARV